MSTATTTFGLTTLCPQCDRPIVTHHERGIGTLARAPDDLCARCAARRAIDSGAFGGGLDLADGAVMASSRAVDVLVGPPRDDPVSARRLARADQAARSILERHEAGAEPDGRGGLRSRHAGVGGRSVEVLTVAPDPSSPRPADRERIALMFCPEDGP